MLPDRYDVIVVGAGILGMASAYHIKKENPGKSVLVVDRYGAPGQGNTGRSNSMYRNTFSSSDNQVLSNASIDFYHHVQDELRVDVGLQEIGYLWLMDDRMLSKSELYLLAMERNGIVVKRQGKEELRRLLPGLSTDFEGDGDAALMSLPSVDGGIFGPKCGRLDPDKLVRFYANEFVKAGGEFALGAEATALALGPKSRLGVEGEPFVWQETTVEGVVVRGKEAPLLAETVVAACGAWENELLEPIGIDGHVKAKKRQLFSIEAKGPKLQELLRSGSFNTLGLVPMVILPKAGVHFKPVSEEGVFWVGCEDEINRPYIDIPDHDLDTYKAEREYYERSVYPVLGSYFPEFKGSKPKAMWAGLYAYNTLDNLPFVFRVGNLIAVAGDSGSGIMKADSLGRIVDSVYRGEDEAMLYGGTHYRGSKLGFEQRDVEREEWVL
jgi:FAD-dependent oxidoreductase domain-containing protein 1